MKGQYTECEEIVANDITDKGLISNIYNHLYAFKISRFGIPCIKGCKKWKVFFIHYSITYYSSFFGPSLVLKGHYFIFLLFIYPFKVYFLSSSI